MQGQTGNAPKRQPFSAVNNRQDVSAATAMNSNECSETNDVDFTKEEVELLLNEKLKSSKFDLKVVFHKIFNFVFLVGLSFCNSKLGLPLLPSHTYFGSTEEIGAVGGL